MLEISRFQMLKGSVCLSFFGMLASYILSYPFHFLSYTCNLAATCGQDGGNPAVDVFSSTSGSVEILEVPNERNDLFAGRISYQTSSRSVVGCVGRIRL